MYLNTFFLLCVVRNGWRLGARRNAHPRQSLLVEQTAGTQLRATELVEVDGWYNVRLAASRDQPHH